MSPNPPAALTLPAQPPPPRRSARPQPSITTYFPKPPLSAPAPSPPPPDEAARKREFARLRQRKSRAARRAAALNLPAPSTTPSTTPTPPAQPTNNAALERKRTLGRLYQRAFRERRRLGLPSPPKLLPPLPDPKRQALREANRARKRLERQREREAEIAAGIRDAETGRRIPRGAEWKLLPPPPEKTAEEARAARESLAAATNLPGQERRRRTRKTPVDENGEAMPLKKRPKRINWFHPTLWPEIQRAAEETGYSPSGVCKVLQARWREDGRYDGLTKGTVGGWIVAGEGRWKEKVTGRVREGLCWSKGKGRPRKGYAKGDAPAQASLPVFNGTLHTHLPSMLTAPAPQEQSSDQQVEQQLAQQLDQELGQQLPPAPETPASTREVMAIATNLIKPERRRTTAKTPRDAAGNPVPLHKPPKRINWFHPALWPEIDRAARDSGWSQTGTIKLLNEHWPDGRYGGLTKSTVAGWMVTKEDGGAGGKKWKETVEQRVRTGICWAKGKGRPKKARAPGEEVKKGGGRRRKKGEGAEGTTTQTAQGVEEVRQGTGEGEMVQNQMGVGGGQGYHIQQPRMQWQGMSDLRSYQTSRSDFFGQILGN